jgi:replicative DNA helicase
MANKLPSALDAEKTILGAIFLEPNKMAQLGTLCANDFFHPYHSLVFQAMQELHAKDQPIDIVTVNDVLVSMGKPGDLTVLSEFTKDLPTAENVAFYSRMVLNKAIQRRFILQCHETMQKAYDPKNGDLEALINEHTIALEKLHISEIDIHRLSDIAKEHIQAVEARISNPELAAKRALKTGIDDLDNMLGMGGLVTGRITTIAAPTNSGKSALAQNIMDNVGKRGEKAIYVSLEDSVLALCVRSISRESKIENQLLQREEVSKKQWTEYYNGASKVIQWGKGVYVIDSAVDSADEMINKVTRATSKIKPQLVVFDYLQLVPSGQKFENQRQHVNHVLDRIIRFSTKNPQIAVVLVSQMTRHDGPPRLRMLKDSGEIENCSHTVLLIHPDWLPGESFKAIDVAKQKDGGKGIIILGWRGKLTKYFSPVRYEAEDYYRKIGRFIG